MNKYWIAPSNGFFDSTNNWSLSSGGSPGASIPGSFDIAFFDTSGQGSCVFNIPVSLEGVRVTADYSGALLQQQYPIVVGSDASFNGGIFIGSSAPITISGSLDIRSLTNFINTSGIMILYGTFNWDSTIVHKIFLEDVITEEYTLLHTDATAKCIKLNEYPRGEEIAVSVVGGVPQEYGLDYYFSGTLRWDGKDLENHLATGDILQVTYTPDSTLMGRYLHNYGTFRAMTTSDIPIFNPNGASFYNLQITNDTTTVTDFLALGQTTRNWMSMAAAPNGDVYACEQGDIYKRTAGVGNFIALGQTTRNWRGMTAAPNGDVYACVSGGNDIYKQTAGVGNFEPLYQTTPPRGWLGMAAAPNGDVYACAVGNDIYKQSGGAGNFLALGQTARQWYALAAAPNGDVYACVVFGDIYKQTAGVGNFIALGQTTREWYGMTAAPNGDVYACANGGDIYKQTAGAGNFIALDQTHRGWRGMAVAPIGNVYACVVGGDIYEQLNISPTGNGHPSLVDSRLMDTSSFIENNLILSAGYMKCGSDGTLNALGNIYSYPNFGQESNLENVQINMNSGGDQNIFTIGGILPHLYVDKTTANQVKFFGNSPLHIDGNFIISDGTVNTNGLFLQVGTL